MSIKENNLVEKRNVLNELRRNSMSLQEMRFFSIYLSKINARDSETRKVKFPLEEFKNIMELGRMNIQHFQAVTNSLLGKVVNVPDGKGGYEGFQLFKRCKVYRDDFEQWFVEIDAHDDALPLMFDFKKEYFTYELWNALRLKSANQLRMYEMLKQYEKIGERKISLVDLKEFLGIGRDEYQRWERFNTRVLKSCQEALAENTDIKFTYETIKTGKKITGVHFFIENNSDYVDQLTLDEFIDLQATKDFDRDPNIIETEAVETAPDINDPMALSIEALPSDLTREQVEALRELALAHMPYGEIYTVQDKEIWLYHYFQKKVKLMKTQKVNAPFAWLKKAVANDWQ